MASSLKASEQGRFASVYSEVQTSRLNHPLPLPSVLKNSFKIVEGSRSSTAGNPDEIAKLFPNFFGQPCSMLGSYRIFQRRSYTRSPQYNNKRLENQPLFPEKPLGSYSWSTYVVPTALVAVIAGAGILVHYNDERRAVLKGSEDDRSTIKGPTIGGPFTLIDTECHLFTERNLRGKWVLLYFGYTSSPDIGPEEIKKLAKAIDILESKHNVKVLPLFVTIDPQRDSPSQLQAYLKEFDPRIVGLTGPDSAIRQMAQEYRVYFKKVEEDGEDYLIESSHNMYLIDPNLEIVRCFGIEYDAEQLSEAILKEVTRPRK